MQRRRKNNEYTSPPNHHWCFSTFCPILFGVYFSLLSDTPHIELCMMLLWLIIESQVFLMSYYKNFVNIMLAVCMMFYHHTVVHFTVNSNFISYLGYV